MQVIQLQCPSCQKKLKVQSELMGKKVKCRCGQKLLVPENGLTTARKESEFPLRSEQANLKEREQRINEEDPVIASASTVLEPTKQEVQHRPKFKLIFALAALLILIAVCFGGYLLKNAIAQRPGQSEKIEAANNAKSEFERAVNLYGSGAYLNAIQVMNQLIEKDPDNMDYRKLRRRLYMAAKNYTLAKEEAAFILSSGKTDKDNDLLLCKLCAESNDSMLSTHFSRLLSNYQLSDLSKLDIEEIICHIIGKKNSSGVTLYFPLYMSSLYDALDQTKRIDPVRLVKINAAVEHTVENIRKCAGLKVEIEILEQSKSFHEVKMKTGDTGEQEDAKARLKSIDDEIAFKKSTLSILTKSIEEVERLRKLAEEAVNRRN